MMSKKRKTTELFWTEKKTAEIKMFYVFIHTKKAAATGIHQLLQPNCHYYM